jgi:Tol biopolymer transport system component
MPSPLLEFSDRTEVWVMDSTGAARVLLPEVPYEIQGGAWSQDGKSIQFTANMGASTQLLKVDVATRQVAQITRGDHAIGGWSYSDDNALHVFTLNSGTRPSEIDTMPASGGAMKRVTAVFDEDLATSRRRGRNA